MDGCKEYYSFLRDFFGCRPPPKPVGPTGFDGSAPPVSPVGRVTLLGVGAFDPKVDITPLEAAHVAALFGLAAVGVPGVHPNYAGYAAEHNLTRHFSK